MIQMDNTGYAAKDVQKARYSKKYINQVVQAQNATERMSSFKMISNTSNYSSMAAKNTSAFKLKNMLEVNKFLK